jgi:hypothetical protein
MHDGIWYIDTLPFQYTTKQKNLPIFFGIFIVRLKNDFTNNYHVFTHMHTFSLLGRMPLLQKGINVGIW